MSEKLVYLSLGLIILVALYFPFRSYQSNTDRLFARFSEQLKEERFEEIYNESSDTMRVSVTKEEFVGRMKVAAAKLKEIDRDLSFRRDKEAEDFIDRVRLNSEGEISPTLLKTYQILEKENKSVLVMVYWDNTGFFPKFNDLSVQLKDKTPEYYAVKGINYLK